MSSSSLPVIRAATLADMPALAAVHVRAWQWAYRGQLPDDFLEGLDATIERRAARRRASLPQPGAARTWVADWQGQLVGFADTGPGRDEDAAPSSGELYAIYLEQAATGQGIGRALLAYAMDDLRQRGYHAATLWVLTSNARARRFYAAAGWRADGTTKSEQHPSGVMLEEVRYRTTLAPWSP